MKSNDKVLLGIIAGIVLLIIVAFVVTLTRPASTYQVDDTPEGVAHNYLLALRNEDYERAYGYLSPTLDGYPRSVDEFVENIQAYSYNFRLDQEATLSVGSSKVTRNNATVRVRDSTFSSGGLFTGGQYSNVFDINLHREGSKWNIVSSDYYFAFCWKWDQGCK